LAGDRKGSQEFLGAGASGRRRHPANVINETTDVTGEETGHRIFDLAMLLVTEIGGLMQRVDLGCDLDDVVDAMSGAVRRESLIMSSANELHT
jgi:hypothetical protein